LTGFGLSFDEAGSHKQVDGTQHKVAYIKASSRRRRQVNDDNEEEKIDNKKWPLVLRR